MAAPQSEVSIGGSLEVWELALLIIAVGAAVALVLRPLIVAWARRIQSPPDLEELSLQVGQLQADVTARLTRLEGRMDFAERVITETPRAALSRPSTEPPLA